MMFSTTLVAAVVAFIPLVSAHVKMVVPKPFAFDQDNSPLDPSGSNFPCKSTGGTYGAVGGTPINPGTQHSFQLMGSAVHGGGSCQISITYDVNPTKDSVWKVIQSYHGACPIFTKGNIGDDANKMLDPIAVMIPAGLKKGNAVFAWTWFNKVGNREMYMDCAPITIGGDSTSDAVFNSLPKMFVANINAPGKQCDTAENIDIIFPEPGKNVITSQEKCTFKAACGGDSPYTPPTQPPAESPVENPIGNPVKPEPTMPEPTPAPYPGQGEGGVFVGVTSSVYNAPPNTEFAPINPAPSTTMSTIAARPTQPSYGGGSDEAPVAAPAPVPAPAPAPAPAPGSGSGGYGSGNGTGNKPAPVAGKCDGTWVVSCESPDSKNFTLCYGKDQMTQEFACAKGMNCAATKASYLKSYKFKRAAHEHIRRRRTVHRHSRH
jgi:hypothetical protein